MHKTCLLNIITYTTILLLTEPSTVTCTN